jgi:hypothetical protein
MLNRFRAREASVAAAAEAAEQEVVHEDNSWGISVVPEEPSSATHRVPGRIAQSRDGLADGIEYSMPVHSSPVMNAVCSAVHLQVHHSCSCQGLSQDVVQYGLLQLSQRGCIAFGCL